MIPKATLVIVRGRSSLSAWGVAYVVLRSFFCYSGMECLGSSPPEASP